jgi:hypothetical protein
MFSNMESQMDNMTWEIQIKLVSGSNCIQSTTVPLRTGMMLKHRRMQKWLKCTCIDEG